MDNQLFTAITTILVAIIGVAFLSVLVSKNANTAGVAGALFGGVAQDIGAAVSPITGANSLASFGNFNSLNLSGNLL